MLAAALVLLGLNASRPDAVRIGFYVLLSAGVLAYAGAGGLIARRVPGNAIGWLLSLAGLAVAMAMLTEQYALYGLATAPGAVPVRYTPPCNLPTSRSGSAAGGKDQSRGVSLRRPRPVLAGGG
jgi:hypothetical protein